MKILSIECSAVSVSCAVSEDKKILGSCFCNVLLTHSETLMPMIKNMLSTAKIPLSEIDAFAISYGPGSFTGIRIGISAVKGLALCEDKPCIPVSSLLAAARTFLDFEGVLCPVMDARCNQFYNALFRVQNGKITRLCPDRAIEKPFLVDELKSIKEPVLIMGDGAELFVKDNPLTNITLAPEHRRFQSAVGVALTADINDAVSPKKLLPFYLRKPQAERELAKKRG